MTNHEIEKLAQAYAGQHETRCKENQFHLAISFMELRAAFIAGYLKGVEYALNEAVEICKQFERTDTISTPFNESARNGISIVRRRIEQIERGE